jgi:hypothetical protein
MNKIFRMIQNCLRRLGIYVFVQEGPLTDEEWDEIKVKPLYEEWLKRPLTEDDYVDQELTDALMRGEITVEEFLAKLDM